MGVVKIDINKLYDESVMVKEKKYTMRDMIAWYLQIREFPSILVFGEGKNQIMGEGQYGGRIVSEIAKEAEILFIKKLGMNHYIWLLDYALNHSRIKTDYKDVKE
jgi:hypothetical protein